MEKKKIVWLSGGEFPNNARSPVLPHAKCARKWYNVIRLLFGGNYDISKDCFCKYDRKYNLGVEVEVDECTTVDAEDFLEADIAVVATYTYGDGELPDEIVDFYEDLAGLDLNGKIYGVVGSGDTFYDEFCKAVDDFDRVFAATGAVKGSECVKVDLSAEDEDIEKLEAFVEELAAKVG